MKCLICIGISGSQSIKHIKISGAIWYASVCGDITVLVLLPLQGSFSLHEAQNMIILWDRYNTWIPNTDAWAFSWLATKSWCENLRESSQQSTSSYPVFRSALPWRYLSGTVGVQSFSFPVSLLAQQYPLKHRIAKENRSLLIHCH